MSTDFLSVFLLSYFILGLLFGIISGINTAMEALSKGREAWKAIILGIAVGTAMTILWFPVAMVIGYRILTTK